MTLDGSLTPGRSGNLTLTVAQDGMPVRDLQPHPGAYDHLVALRSGDVAHCTFTPTSGRVVRRTSPRNRHGPNPPRLRPNTHTEARRSPGPLELLHTRRSKPAICLAS